MTPDGVIAGVQTSSMAEPKTRPTDVDPATVIATIADEQRRRDCGWLIEVMQQATGEKPVMWGPSMIGFGSYPYQGASSKGLWPIIGFGPKTGTLSVYVMPGFGIVDDLLQRLGPHSHGVSCLYLKSLDRLDTDVLRELIVRTVTEMKARTKNGTTPFVSGTSEYATSAAKARRDARATKKKAAPKKPATKKPATKKPATKKPATKKA